MLVHAYWLLQTVVDWVYSLNHDVGALPTCQELAVIAGEEQEHAVSGFELPGLSRSVVHMALFSLGPLQVLLYNGHDSIDPGLHVLDVFNQESIGRWLLLPGFLGNV